MWTRVSSRCCSSSLHPFSVSCLCCWLSSSSEPCSLVFLNTDNHLSLPTPLLCFWDTSYSFCPLTRKMPPHPNSSRKYAHDERQKPCVVPAGRSLIAREREKMIVSRKLQLLLPSPPTESRLFQKRRVSWAHDTISWATAIKLLLISCCLLLLFSLPYFSPLLDVNYCWYRLALNITGEYSCLTVNLDFKREFSYYLIQIYIPCCMLVIVSWVSFWLDPNAIPARVSLGVTTLLTMATQISGINASLPPVSYTKAIDVWTGSCLTFVFGALLEFALVNYASRSDAHRAGRKKKQQQAALTAQRKVDLELQEAGFEVEDSFEAASLPFAKVEVRVEIHWLSVSSASHSVIL